MWHVKEQRNHFLRPQMALHSQHPQIAFRSNNQWEEHQNTMPAGFFEPDVHLHSYFCDQNLQLDAFIQLQNQKLQEAVEESRKIQFRSLVRIMEQEVQRKLEVTETELQKAKRVNADLEEKIKQMSEENQMWFNMAKNNEATVFSLRQSLAQLLLYNNHDKPANINNTIEGFGETADEDDDAASPLIQPAKSKEYWEEKNKKTIKSFCKGCGGGRVSILVLPCRHLCLCKDCELRLHCCPICNSFKNASLEVFFS
ncbi:probable BOI-related E3 ubiquitin-protein ligase 2 [Mangifera indica]|uniref:probable BOI-related E3 ubiquitin-protein ligase 2 n=1 Tax=Mangifera indica TaxID=29780 RepID=UPI001CFBB501|nr:probable BOI-related E3 ubiquitin-protein ligase 2 [Mangifera indica]